MSRVPSDAKFNKAVFEVGVDQRGLETLLVKKTVGAAEIGIVGTSGHALRRLAVADEGWQRAAFMCSCGRFEMRVRVNIGGHAGSTAKRSWAEHLEAESADVDEIIEIGVISRERDDQRITVMPVNGRTAADYIVNSRAITQRLTRIRTGYCWLVCGETPRRRVALDLCSSKQDAMFKALRTLEKAELQGCSVRRDSGLMAPQVVMTAGHAVAGLITEAQEARSVSEMDAAIARINEVLAVMPGLTHMRDQLAANREAALIGPRERITE